MLPTPSEHRGKKSVEDDICNILVWRKRAPKFTTFRVNSLVTTPSHFIETLQQSLRELSAERALLGNSFTIPQIWQHHLLPEAVGFGSWSRDYHLARLEKEVIVDPACGAAVLRGAHVFVPGVIGMFQGATKGDNVSIYADIGGICKRGWTQKLDEEHRFFVGNGMLLLDRKEIFCADGVSHGIAVRVIDAESGCPSLPPNFPQPCIAVMQNLPSIVCAHVLDPQPGEMVLDMCAAPGNKTTHLAALMRNKGIIVALDRSASRMSKLKQLCEDMSVKNVTAFVCNAITAATSGRTEFVNLNQRKQHVLNGPPFLGEIFDRILLDAPCSALGQRPRLDKIDMKHITSYPVLQRKLFETAVKLLKPGGVLVYSTCTVMVGENEGIVRWALDQFPVLNLVPADPCLYPSACEEDVCSNILSSSERRCLQKYVPTVDNATTETLCEKDTIGFFIARFEKRM